MTDQDIRKASLAEIRAMKDTGKVASRSSAVEAEDLGAEFWAKAELVSPEKRSVHLKIENEVFDFFYEETNGKGHLTKMQNVLRAYMRARKAG
ncbi:hypothetical protein [Rhizobium deserti]|uniref:hypothetical protein n=1 Tax=Rhizobium deserti TaxID=2547961 RepID=UPI00192A5241|nr:hypothetical protein [Rhizobium deserti]